MRNPFSNSSRRDRSTDVRELQRLVKAIEIDSFTNDDKARTASWREWEHYLNHATWREHNCRTAFYGSRLVSIIAAITVPSLVGLNLSGTGGAVVRWITFAFSLIAAFATAILTLYQVSDRWLMYRQLMVSLMKAGETLASSASAKRQMRDAAWQNFVRAKDQAISSYNDAYTKAVILVAQNPERKDSSHGDIGTAP